MTPQEIVDYKNKWKMAAYFVVSVHTDFRSDIGVKSIVFSGDMILKSLLRTIQTQ